MKFFFSEVSHFTKLIKFFILSFQFFFFGRKDLQIDGNLSKHICILTVLHKMDYFFFKLEEGKEITPPLKKKNTKQKHEKCFLNMLDAESFVLYLKVTSCYYYMGKNII